MRVSTQERSFFVCTQLSKPQPQHNLTQHDMKVTPPPPPDHQEENSSTVLLGPNCLVGLVALGERPQDYIGIISPSESKRAMIDKGVIQASNYKD